MAVNSSTHHYLFVIDWLVIDNGVISFGQNSMISENGQVLIITTTKDNNFEEESLLTLKKKRHLKAVNQLAMAVPPEMPDRKAEMEILQKQLLALLIEAKAATHSKSGCQCTIC